MEAGDQDLGEHGKGKPGWTGPTVDVGARGAKIKQGAALPKSPKKPRVNVPPGFYLQMSQPGAGKVVKPCTSGHVTNQDGTHSTALGRLLGEHYTQPVKGYLMYARCRRKGLKGCRPSRLAKSEKCKQCQVDKKGRLNDHSKNSKQAFKVKIERQVERRVAEAKAKMVKKEKELTWTKDVKIQQLSEVCWTVTDKIGTVLKGLAELKPLLSKDRHIIDNIKSKAVLLRRAAANTADNPGFEGATTLEGGNTLLGPNRSDGDTDDSDGDSWGLDFGFSDDTADVDSNKGEGTSRLVPPKKGRASKKRRL